MRLADRGAENHESGRVLFKKNIKAKGLKPDLAQAVAWNSTKAEVEEWLAQQEAALQPPAPLADRSQPSSGQRKPHDFFHSA